MTVIPLFAAGPIPGLPLPPGRWRGDLWVSRGGFEAHTYADFVAMSAETGYWPVVLYDDPRFPRPGQDWVADRGWLPPVPDVVSTVDPGAMLASWWESSSPPGRPFPGLARRTSRRVDLVRCAAIYGSLLAAGEGSRLGFVRTTRAADVPAVLGWPGMRPCTEDVAGLSAVLRSWEERFGAVLVGLSSDELVLAVAAPPSTRHRALAVAAEHRAFCPPSLRWAGESLSEVADELRGATTWRFWWS